MNELDTLRPEVRSALGAIVRADVCRDPVPTDAFDTIRAELLRLQSTESRANEWQLRAERAEAELAALKARIAKPVDRSHKYVQSKEHGGCSECGYPEWEPWHRVALVKAEE